MLPAAAGGVLEHGEVLFLPEAVGRLRLRVEKSHRDQFGQLQPLGASDFSHGQRVATRLGPVASGSLGPSSIFQAAAAAVPSSSLWSR